MRRILVFLLCSFLVFTHFEHVFAEETVSTDYPEKQTENSSEEESANSADDEISDSPTEKPSQEPGDLTEPDEQESEEPAAEGAENKEPSADATIPEEGSGSEAVIDGAESPAEQSFDDKESNDLVVSDGEQETDETDAQNLDEKESIEEAQTKKQQAEEAKEVTPNITVSAHVENYGWMAASSGEHVQVGTTGRSLRMEALRFTLSEEMKDLGDIEINCHVQNIGWLGSVHNDQIAGTTGRSLRLEAIRISLTGELAEKFDISYRVHVQNIGWTGWVKNGALAGTTGQSLRLEAIEIQLQKKGTSQAGSGDTVIVVPQNSGGPIMPLSARAHCQDIGWTGYVDNGGVIGTTGRSLHMEALTINLSNDLLAQGNVQVQTHVANIGWLGGVGSGQTAGTTGQGLQLEGVRISLTGALSEKYDIYYRAHVANVGWLPWTWNGELAGSEGCSRAIEALQIEIAEKNTQIHSLGQGYIVFHKARYNPVYYSQTDSAWAGSIYGRWKFSSTGCVPTAIAMSLSGMINATLKPPVIAEYLHNIGTYNNGFAGASSDSIPFAASHWGAKAFGLNSANDIRNALRNGRTVLIAVNPGTFCPPGVTHEILLFNLNLNETYVYDPLMSSRNGWYNVDMIWDQRSSASVDWIGGYVAYALDR